MFKKLISMVIALTLSFSLILSAASCTKEGEMPEEIPEEESVSGSESEDDGGNSSSETEEEKFINFFEYIESVKDVSAVKVFDLEDTVTTLKTLVKVAYSTGMVTRKFLIDTAISQAKIDGVASLSDVCAKIEEEYAYAILLDNWATAADEIKEPVHITLEELDKYGSYEELLLAQKDELVAETTEAASYMVSVLGTTGLDALKAFLAYKGIDGTEELTADGVKLIYSYLVVPTLKDNVKSKLEEIVEKAGLDEINAAAEQSIGMTFEDTEELLDYVDGLIDYASENYIEDALGYALDSDANNLISLVSGSEFDPEAISSYVIAYVSDEGNYKAIADCLEKELPYAQLKAQVEEEAINLVYLDLVSMVLGSFAEEDNGYYSLVNTVFNLDEIVLTEELKDKIVGNLETIESYTVGELLDMIVAAAAKE